MEICWVKESSWHAPIRRQPLQNLRGLGRGLHGVQVEHPLPSPSLGDCGDFEEPPRRCSSLYYVQNTSSPEGVITVKKDEKGHSVNHYLGNLNKCICAHILITEEDLSTFTSKDLCAGTTKPGKDIGIFVEFICTVLEFWAKFWRF